MIKKQLTFSDIEYSGRRKTTRKAEFLAIMNEITPWSRLCKLIEPHYFRGIMGRPPIGIESMLRMYFLQIWFSLSDEMTEDSIYDSRAMQEFMGINFLEKQAPDATTLLKFRHLLNDSGLQVEIQKEINSLLEENSLVMHGGTIVDATIIQAPSSTRNAKKERDAEMKSTRKGKNYHFGMKAHIGVDAGSGAVVSTSYTAANTHDINEAHNNFRDDDTIRFGDSGYIGVEKRAERQKTEEEITYSINKKPSKRTEKHSYPQNWEKQIERRKSAVRWKVEYVFYIVKRIFGCAKAIYKGIEKNASRFEMAFASANLYMFRHRLRTPLPPT